MHMTCTCTLQPQLQSMTPILLHLSGQSVVGWRDELGNKSISSLMWTLISILNPNRFNHGLMAAGRLLLECRVTYSDGHWALRIQFLCLFTVHSHTTKNLSCLSKLKYVLSTTLSPFPPTLNCLLHASNSCCCSKINKAVFADENGLLTQIIPVVVQYVALPVRIHIECLHLQFLLLRQSHTNRTQKQHLCGENCATPWEALCWEFN